MFKSTNLLFNQGRKDTFPTPYLKVSFLPKITVSPSTMLSLVKSIIHMWVSDWLSTLKKEITYKIGGLYVVNLFSCTSFWMEPRQAYMWLISSLLWVCVHRFVYNVCSPFTISEISTLSLDKGVSSVIQDLWILISSIHFFGLVL